MSTKIGNVTRDVLVNAPLPAATKTYTVISHQFIIDTIEDALQANGFTVTGETFKCTADAQVAQGVFKINYEGDPELGLMYTFSNSYDKSLRFRAAVGAQIKSNGSYMVSESESWKRVHTGTADTETEQMIIDHIQNAQQYFDQLKQAKDLMKNIVIDADEFAAIVGQLFIRELIGVDQLSMIFKENKKPSYVYEDEQYNLWTCYQQVTNGLNQAHPFRWMKHHVAVHMYFIAKYDLTIFDEEEAEEETVTLTTDGVEQPVIDGILEGVETLPVLPGFTPPAPVDQDEVEEYVEPVDPNQIDLEDSIAEVSALPDVTLGETRMMTKEEIEEEYGEDVVLEEDEDWDVLKAKEVEFPQQIEEDEEVADGEHVEAPEGVDVPWLEEKQEEEAAAFVKEAAEVITAGTPTAHVETDEEYNARVANIEGEAEEELIDPDDLLYFSLEDYPDKVVGEFIEVEETYYEIIAQDTQETGVYWVCQEVQVMGVETVTPEEPIVLGAEDENEVAAVRTALEEAGINTNDFSFLPKAEEGGNNMPDIAPPTDPVVLEQVDELEHEDTSDIIGDFEAEDIPEEVPEASDIPDDLGEDTSPVKMAIASELEDIYGEVPEFTYVLGDNQYNVTLSTGESITLSSAYIDAAI